MSCDDIIYKMDDSNLAKIARTCLQDLLNNGKDLNMLNDDDALLSVGVACLQCFVQSNWTGPESVSSAELAVILNLETEEFNEAEKCLSSSLAVDGEPVYERVTYPTLLALSRHLLSKAITHSDKKSMLWLMWQLRSVYVHQAMIDERCNSLKSEAMDCINKLMSGEGLTQSPQPNAAEYSDLDHSSRIDWKLLAAGLSRFYFEHNICKRLMAQAESETGLKISTQGIPGKRTRYQNKDIAQLILTVQRGDQSHTSINSPGQSQCGAGDQSQVDPAASNQSQTDPAADIHLPKNELLQDDTVLENIKLIDGSEVHIAKLNAVEQSLLLALCEENQYVRGDADTDITAEETTAYISYILSQPCDWSVQFRALLIRSVSEKKSGRRIERSLRQLEGLSSLNTRLEPCAADRLRRVYSSRLPPSWQVQRTYGELQMEVGAYASAMEIFDRLGLWDPLIVCSQRAGRTGKAEEIIRSRLAVGETAPLYCSLSDVTADPQYYHNAWELSNYRSARAMRGLAFYHLRACQYDDAIECFEKSLTINPLQLSCWFSFGCASLAAGYYEKAASAFRRTVILNEDNFEAWNNLAAAYARNNQKPRAFAVLQDAIKCSYDNWKVWENYTVIGSDCGQISEVIRGAHRILELTGKWNDDQVVEHLTRMVLEDIHDANDRPSSIHREALLKLLGHTAAKVTNSSVLWRCYGRVILAAKEFNQDNTERGIQCLQKGYRCATSSAGWEKSEEKCKLNTDFLLELVNSYKVIGSKKYIGTAKLQLKGHIARLKQGHTDPVTKQVTSELIMTLLNSLELVLEGLPVPTTD